MKNIYIIMNLDDIIGAHSIVNLWYLHYIYKDFNKTKKIATEYTCTP